MKKNDSVVTDDQVIEQYDLWSNMKPGFNLDLKKLGKYTGDTVVNGQKDYTIIRSRREKKNLKN